MTKPVAVTVLVGLTVAMIATTLESREYAALRKGEVALVSQGAESARAGYTAWVEQHAIAGFISPRLYSGTKDLREGTATTFVTLGQGLYVTNYCAYASAGQHYQRYCGSVIVDAKEYLAGTWFCRMKEAPIHPQARTAGTMKVSLMVSAGSGCDVKLNAVSSLVQNELGVYYEVAQAAAEGMVTAR